MAGNKKEVLGLSEEEIAQAARGSIMAPAVSDLEAFEAKTEEAAKAETAEPVAPEPPATPEAPAPPEEPVTDWKAEAEKARKEVDEAIRARDGILRDKQEALRRAQQAEALLQTWQAERYVAPAAPVPPVTGPAAPSPSPWEIAGDDADIITKGEYRAAQNALISEYQRQQAAYRRELQNNAVRAAHPDFDQVMVEHLVPYLQSHPQGQVIAQQLENAGATAAYEFGRAIAASKQSAPATPAIRRPTSPAASPPVPSAPPVPIMPSTSPGTGKVELTRADIPRMARAIAEGKLSDSQLSQLIPKY